MYTNSLRRSCGATTTHCDHPVQIRLIDSARSRSIDGSRTRIWSVNARAASRSDQGSGSHRRFLDYKGRYHAMLIRTPLTIEIIGLKDGNLVVLDRVIGGTVYVDEAKRIGRRLLSIVDTEARPKGYRIISDDRELIYAWHAGQGDELSQ